MQFERGGFGHAARQATRRARPELIARAKPAPEEETAGVLTRSRGEAREIRHLRVRRRVRGTAEQPRLSVFRSLNHVYAQLIEDGTGRTLVSIDSRSSEFRQRLTTGGNVAAAKLVGELLAQKATARGIKRVVFDRGGYQYHGRVKALAEAARAGGLVF